ncbi:MAG: hypothetical protein ACI8RZ_004386, partial [Myxococcota bacterium]
MLPLLLLACGEDVDTPAASVPEGCDPLILEVCALPFPSTAMMTPDDTTASGWRMAIPEAGLPVDIDGVVTDPWAWNERDGFSTWGPLVFWLADLGDVPGHEAVGEQAIVSVIDVETGESVPVWLEPDAAAEDPDQRTVAVRFAAPMRHGARHVVAVRGLTDSAGSAISDMEIPASRADYYASDILPVLADAGIETDGLQLAWDFVTHSTDSALGVAEFLREDAAAQPSPTHTITEVLDADCAEEGVTIGRTIEGTVTAPSYLTDDGELLTRDADGMPVLSDTVEVDFIAQIPCSLLADPRPALTIQFGHGLLGSREESTQAYLGELLDDHSAVMIASDWRGMSKDDRGDITLMMATDLGMFPRVPERTLQGFVELDTVMRHLQEGGFDDEPALMVGDVAVIDPAQTTFYGISQGGIIGVGYLGFSQRLSRGGVSVPGGPFTTIMPRSIHFDAFRLILETRYPDARDVAVMLGVLETLWEPAEGSGWVSSMDDDVLIQTATGDAQVSAFASHNIARALDARSVAPQIREIWGVDEADGGFSGSAIAEWRYLDGGEDPETGVSAD